MVITDKKAVAIFSSVVVVLVLVLTLAFWAQPMTMEDSNDVNSVATLLAENDSVVEIVSIGDVGVYKDTEYQLVTYTVVKDSVISNKTAMIEVKKDFLNYKCVGVLKP